MKKNHESTRAYPLYWPEGWPRTDVGKIKRAQFKDRSVFTARRELELEVRRFGGRDLIISSNRELKLDGTPRSIQKQPEDRGVAIYFMRNGEEAALGIDVYSTVEDNAWALVRTIQCMRQIERDGGATITNKAFKGFLALPDPDKKNWWDVLGIPRESTQEEVKKAYFLLAKTNHPDLGGDPIEFDIITKAYNTACKETR